MFLLRRIQINFELRAKILISRRNIYKLREVHREGTKVFTQDVSG